jgi:hypothetical protein
MMFAVIVPVSVPFAAEIVITDDVADDGLEIVVVPAALALEPRRIWIQRLAGITAVFEVIVTEVVVVATPHVRPDAAAVVLTRASVNPEQVAEVLVARAILVVPRAPSVHPTGKFTATA